MEATTTRASTVIRSIPTSDTRTQASITMPLSSTRSRTSIRLVPPVVLSTGIASVSLGVSVTTLSARPGGAYRGQRRDLSLEHAHLLAQFVVFGRESITARGKVAVVFPPVQADLLRLVDRAYDQPNPDREELDLGQRNFYVTGDDQSFIEYAIEDVDKTAAAPVWRRKIDSDRRCHLASGGKYRPWERSL